MTRPSAPRGYAKTGKGRHRTKGPAVPSVESVACAATLGAECHVLSNDARGRTACVWCGEGWGALDAGLRGAA